MRLTHQLVPLNTPRGPALTVLRCRREALLANGQSTMQEWNELFAGVETFLMQFRRDGKKKKHKFVKDFFMLAIVVLEVMQKLKSSTRENSVFARAKVKLRSHALFLHCEGLLPDEIYPVRLIRTAADLDRIVYLIRRRVKANRLDIAARRRAELVRMIEHYNSRHPDGRLVIPDDILNL